MKIKQRNITAWFCFAYLFFFPFPFFFFYATASGASSPSWTWSAADRHLAHKPRRKGQRCWCYCSSYCHQSWQRTRVCVCAEGWCVLLAFLSLRVCAKTAVRIGAEGLRAGNTSSWLGTSDTLFTSLPLWTADPPCGSSGGGGGGATTCVLFFLHACLGYNFVVYCSCVCGFYSFLFTSPAGAFCVFPSAPPDCWCKVRRLRE